jgi:hypothetical protein
MEEKIEYRMYFLTNYQLTGIQSGIQAGHAAIEYSLKYQDDEDYQEWARHNKTFIILNGGATNTNPDNLGTINRHLQTLKDNGIKVAEFYEPDLGDQLTAIAFLVEERVFNKLKYPDFDRELVTYKYQDEIEWINTIGKKNAFLRNFLSSFKLA